MQIGMENQNLTEIMTCIEKRQQIIDRIEPGNRSVPSQELKAFFKDISAAEKECIRICKSDLEALRTQLLNERRKRQGRQGYGAAPDRPAPRFVDQRVC